MAMPMPPSTIADEFRTRDLGISAFLVARETPLLRTEQEGRITIFVFPGSAETLARLFYHPGQNTVDARKFHVALRELRGLTEVQHW